MDQRRINAASLGIKTYAGDACRKCSNTKRYTLNGQCAYCVNERAKASAKKRDSFIKELIAKAQSQAEAVSNDITN